MSARYTEPSRLKDRAAKLKGKPVVFDPPAEEESGAAPSATDPEALMELPFFDHLAALTTADWEKHIVYLYRTEPRVRNAGEFSYIDRYRRFIDEEAIKNDHGGGSYHLKLKGPGKGSEDTPDKKVLLRVHNCSIDGAPKFLAGQTVLGDPAAAPKTELPTPPTAPAAAQNPEVMTQILELLRDKDKPQADAFKQAMELIITAQKKGQEIVAESARAQNGSATGNALGDRLLEAFIANMGAGGKKSRTDEMQEMITMMELVDKMRGPREKGTDFLAILDKLPEMAQRLQASTGIDLLSAVKRLFGGSDAPAVDDFKTILANKAGAALENLPDTIRAFSEMKEADFRRSLAVHQLKNGNPGVEAQPAPGRPILAAAPPPGPSRFQDRQPVPFPPPRPDSPPQPAAPAEAPPATPQQVQTVSEEVVFSLVVRGFEAGESGETVAVAFDLAYPLIVHQLKPYLQNPSQVKLWAASHKVLSKIASEEGFDEFLQEFCAELLRPAETEPEPSPVPA